MPETLESAFAGERIGTVFAPATRMRGKRRWLAYAAGVRGRVVVDAGAQRAITAGKASLLNSGVVRVEREFAADGCGEHTRPGRAGICAWNCGVCKRGAETPKERKRRHG